MDKYKEGLIQRPVPDRAHLEAARLGDPTLTWDPLINRPMEVGRTRGLATGEIRDPRAPHSGHSEDHTLHLQAFGDRLPLPSAAVFGRGRDAKNYADSLR